MEPVAVHTSDGFELAASLAKPASRPAAVVLIIGAMGVAQDFYAPLASWLASKGTLAVTFDFRGIGRSRRGPLARLDADILTWARLDTGALLDFAAAQAPGVPLLWLGHSLGGQIVPFVPGHEKLARIVTVAAGSGYWKENVPSLRWRAPLLWHVVVPLALPLFGYFPGRRLGMVGDVPRGVMAQWRRWCLNPDYAAGVEGEAARAAYAAVKTPIVSLSFTDDEFMSKESIASLNGFYTGAPRVMTRLAPADLGVERVGHFGFFRPRFREALWEAHLLPALRDEGGASGRP